MGRKAGFFNALAASEMYCSLMHEDVRGCPYNAFDRLTVTWLASASSILAVIALLIGY